MSILSQTIAVTATRVAIPVQPALAYADGAFLELRNGDAANSVRIGGDDISYASGGTLIPPGGTWYSQGVLREGDTFYAVCDTALTATLDVLWSRV